MKKILAILLAVMMIAGLAACSNTAEEEKDVNFEDFYQAVIDDYTAQGADVPIMFPEASDEFIDTFYPGLLGIELTQKAFYMPPVTGFACEMAMVRVADKADADAVAEIFQARIDKEAEHGAYPEINVQWQRNAQVITKGTYVMMLVFPDGLEFPQHIIDEMF